MVSVQTTLKSPVSFSGVGLHSGATVRVTVHPASAEYGIWFRRTDIEIGDTMIPARWDFVEISPLCTKIVNNAGVSVSTIEHIMAALAGCGIHNALIEIDGPEVPILDGSSAKFVKAFLNRGIKTLSSPVRMVEVLKTVEVHDGASTARFEPAHSLHIDFAIDFVDQAIGQQHKSLDMSNGTFVRELCDSRTFCRQSDVDAMHAQGLALGGTLENAVVVDGDDILSPGGFRHRDEAVRHKMLDALGDLSLAGHPIMGRYTGLRAGHAMTNRLLRALFSDTTAFRVITCGTADIARLPGFDLHQEDLPLIA
nr:UDP-3-O-acyl-N-acetylglucosamine deacetylase [Sulfitobacter algicola]